MYMEYTQRGMQAQPFGTQVVRVFVEDRGCIGFVDVDEHAGTTLEHVRKKIGEDLDGVSEDFHFLLEMGGGESVPVQHKQEKNRFVRQGKVLIRTMSPPRSAESQGSANSATGTASSGPPGNRMVVTVVYCDPDGRRHKQVMRVTPTETFAQLRREASDSWGLKPSNLVLRDDNDYLWPDGATLLSVGEPDRLPVYLMAKERLGAGEPAIDSARAAEVEGELEESDAECGVDYRKELWNIFTFYCTDSNPLMLERMTMKVFQRLARDCGIVRERDDRPVGREAPTSLRPHEVDIVFSAEAAATLNAEKRGTMVGQLKQHVGGGNAGKAALDWDGFFNALDAIGRRLRHAGAGDGELFNATVLEAEQSALVHVLTTYVLPQRDEQYDPPGAKRWNVTTWADTLSKLRDADIHRVFQHFATCLFEVFRFYATTNHEAEDDNFVEYTNWRKFISDFNISALHLSSRDLAEIFLASAQSHGTHCRLNRSSTGPVSRRAAYHPPGTSPPTNSPETGSTVSEMPLEGRHLQMDKHAPFGQTRLFFPQFLDSIGLCALFVRPHLSAEQQQDVSALNLVKSLFQNVGRALNRSNMVRVVQMRESRLHGCLRDSGGFLRASVVFGHRLMSMWRKEGSVDYLTGESMIDCPPVSPSMARGVQGAVGRSRAAESRGRSRGSPLHRAATSRAALDGASEFSYYSSPKDPRKRYGRHIMEQLLDTGINRSLAASVNSPSRTPAAVKITENLRTMSDRSPARGTSSSALRGARSSSDSHLGHALARMQNSRKDLRFDKVPHTAPSGQGPAERRDSTTSVRSEARSEAHASRSHSRGHRQRHMQRGGSSRSVSSVQDQAPRALPVTVKSDTSAVAQQSVSPPRPAPEPPVQPETERTPMRAAPSPPLKPFVMVTQVQDGSPAAEAGLCSGDGIVEIGGVNATNDSEAAEGGVAGTKAIGRVVRGAENQKINIIVQRGTQMITLAIVPRQWSGAGLLGCGLNVVQPGSQSEHLRVLFEAGPLGLRFQRLQDGRARVESVDGQAQAKGVAAGDIIVAVGETPVEVGTNIGQLVSQAGRPFTMEFERILGVQPSAEQQLSQIQREQQMQQKRQEESDRKKVELLRRGAIFTKHSTGTFSSNKRRLLNWSQQHNCVQWRPPTSPLDDDSQVKSIQVTEIAQVLAGARTSPSKKKKSKSEAADDDIALIIVTRNKQLRFDADSPQQRNDWVDALNWLLARETAKGNNR